MLHPDHPNTLVSVNSLAALYESTWRFGEAEPHYQRALTARERVLGRDHPDTLDSVNRLAILYARTGRYGEAELLLHRALTGRERVLGPDHPDLLAAIDAVKSGRRQLSNVALNDSVLPAEKTRLRQSLEAAEADLRARSAKYQRFLAAKTADAEDIQLTLNAGAALVEYRFYSPFDFKEGTFGEARLLAAILRGDAGSDLVDLGEAGILFELQALTVEKELRTKKGLAFDAPMRSGHERLIAPLLPHLDGIETLYIAPDGPLQALPFEAFLDEPGLRLIERFRVRTLQTSRDLVARDRPVTGTGLVALGGIDFERADHAAAGSGVKVAAVDPGAADATRAALDVTRAQFSAFQALPASGQEVTAIGQAYAALRPDEPALVVLKGADATEAAVKALAAPPRVLHFATHGYYLESGSIEGRPLLQSGITLAGANDALNCRSGQDGENGILHAVEVQTLNLYGTELVVLSASDTGQGAHDYSEGLEGLPRAFWRAPTEWPNQIVIA